MSRSWPANKPTNWYIGEAIALVAIGSVVTLGAWVRTAGDVYSNYVFLVPIVVAWLIWVRRVRFQQCTLRKRFVGLFLLGVGGAFFVAGSYFSSPLFWYTGALLAIAGCVLSALGVDACVRFLPAFFTLALVVPLPREARQWIESPLGAVSVQAARGTQQLLGVSPDKWVPSTRESVATQGASVLHILCSVVLVAIAVVFGAPLRNSLRLLIISVCLFGAFIFNLVLVVFEYGMFSGRASDFRSLLGWSILPLALVLVVGGWVLLRRTVVPVAHYSLPRGN